MANQLELLYCQEIDEMNRNGLLLYEKAVLGELLRQEFLNEIQFRHCVQKLERHI